MIPLGDERYRMAVALAPFLADHYYATGQDFVDVAAGDQTIVNLALLYTCLPEIAERATEATAQAQNSGRSPDQGRRLSREANQLLNDTAEAIRHRLAVLANGSCGRTTD